MKLVQFNNWIRLGISIFLATILSSCLNSANPNTPVLQSITVPPVTQVLVINSTYQFTAIGNYSDGSTADATALAKWSSDTPSIATINSSGLATGVSVGTATVTATLGAISGSNIIPVVATTVGTINVSTLAGSGTAGAVDATGNQASFYYPFGVAVDATGNVYVSDWGNNKIRKISTAGVVSTFAGNGTATELDGTGIAASFNTPNGIAVDASGNVYVSDQTSNVIRQITPGGVVTTFAGSGAAAAVDATGTYASFHNPVGLATDASANLYVADKGNNTIRMITSAGVVTTLAGSGTLGAGDGTGAAASFNNPSGVAVDTSGNIYVADNGNNEIRKVTSAGVVTTFAGSTTAGSADGTGTAASFNHPFGIAVDTAGNIYVADSGNYKIRKITSAGVVTTVTGSGAAGAVDGPAIVATFYTPNSVAVDSSGNIYIADTYNNKIRTLK